MRQCCRVKRRATRGNQTASSSSSRRYRYSKVLDNRKHAIRGLWRRNGKFVARMCNLALVVLRNVLKNARMDGFIKNLPVEGIPWQRSEKKARRLHTREDVDQFCQAASVGSKNGAELADYFRLLALCGAHEQETIKLRWADVDFEHKLLTIGVDADTKNREARHVDFNSELESHLKAMQARARRIRNGCFRVRNEASGMSMPRLSENLCC